MHKDALARTLILLTDKLFCDLIEIIILSRRVSMFFRDIKNTMAQVEQQFRKNELAYLAFTSKVEVQVRDKFAWILL